MRIRDWATLFVVAGYSVFPIATNTKKPACRWKCYQERFMQPEEINGWRCHNLAVATGKLSSVVVVDCDTRENAEWFVKHRGDTPMKTVTKRGMHLYFRWPSGFRVDQKLRNAAHVQDEFGCDRYDLRAEGGFVMAPPSAVDGFHYAFADGIVPACRLPSFWLDWLPSNRFEAMTRLPPQPQQETDSRKLRWARREAMKCRAISGGGGHNVTFRVAGMFKFAGLGKRETMSEMRHWNATNAEPKWSEKELSHKVEDCFRSCKP